MNDHKDIFSHLNTPEPHTGLAERILLNIEECERRNARIRIAVSAVVFCISLWAIGVGCVSFADGLAKSGFLSLFSLIFSDFSSIMSSLPDFIFSTIESFPIFSTALMLSGVTFAIGSFAVLMQESFLIKNELFSSLK